MTEIIALLYPSVSMTINHSGISIRALLAGSMRCSVFILSVAAKNQAVCFQRGSAETVESADWRTASSHSLHLLMR